MPDESDRIEELEKKVRALQEQLDESGVSRRDVLAGAGGGALAGLLGVGSLSASTEQASASTAPNYGTPSNPADFYVVDLFGPNGGVNLQNNINGNGQAINNLGSVSTGEADLTASGGGPGGLTLDNSAAQIAVDNHIVPVSPGLGTSDAVPLSNTNPINDAIRAVAQDGGGQGYIVYPPQSGSDPITQADSIINEPEVSHVSPGRTEIRITGGGEDLFVVDGARAVTASAGDLFPYVNIIGSFRIEHANGPTGDSGRGIVFEDNLAQSWWGTIEAVGTNGHGFYDNSSTYQCVFNHIGVRQTNPRSENTTSAVQFNAGGAPYNIEYLTVYPYDDGASNVEAIRYFGAANPQIGTVNIGGAAGRAVNAAQQGYHGVHINHINYEPGVNNGDINEIVNQGSPRPFYLGGITLYGNTPLTVDKIIRMGQSTNVRIPQPVIRTSDISFTDVVRVDNDTQTAPNLPTSSIIYEGPSADVNNNTGSTLTEPIACLGDLTTVN